MFFDRNTNNYQNKNNLCQIDGIFLTSLCVCFAYGSENDHCAPALAPRSPDLFPVLRDNFHVTESSFLKTFVVKFSSNMDETMSREILVDPFEFIKNCEGRRF